MANTKSKKKSKGKHSLHGTATGGGASKTSQYLKGKKAFFGMPKSLKEDKLLSILAKSGLILGSFIGVKELDRLFLKSGEKEGIKKYLAPLAAIGGGLYLTTTDNEIFKFVGYKKLICCQHLAKEKKNIEPS